MKFIRLFTALALVASLAACGGGGGCASSAACAPAAAAATTTVVVTPAETPATVEVLTSSNTLLSAGSEVVITAFIKSATNVGMAGQTVTLAASSGSLLASSLTTDANGVVTAKLTAGSNKFNRDITVTVGAGSVSGNVVIPVTGTRISVAGDGSLQAAAVAQYTVRALDSSGNPISGASIAVASVLGNSLGAVPPTDTSGNTSFIYTANRAGTDTITVTGLGVTAKTTVSVNAIDFAVLSPASNVAIPVTGSQVITVRYRNLGAGVAGATVNFSTTRGTFLAASAVTNAAGEATATLSSTTAGPATVVAQIPGIGQANLPVQFVATTPATVVVQANPGAVSPNLSGTSNQSTVEAVVRDAAGNAVQGRQVNFSTLKDLSNGTLQPGNAITDFNGRAQVQFIPGANSTPANGVVIQAVVASTAITATTSLTVNGQALFITIGFGNTIGNVDETTYRKPFSVYVTDANGVAVGNQIVTLSVIPETYSKGTLGWNGVVWTYSSPPTGCPNEDANGNGILDAGEDNGPISGNNDGSLTPGNIAVSAPGSVTTDTSGRATFDLQYGEQYAPWAKVRLSARAAVGGTESKQSILFDLSGLASDFNVETVAPAGAVSPFGIATSCTDKT
jgi:3D (Asp-Asp-Asp) domain-containing protein